MAINETGKKSRRRRQVTGAVLIRQLNELIAQLIKENRKLKRQVDKLSARGSASATGVVDRSLRTLQRRVQRALGAKGTRKKRAAQSSAVRGRPRNKATKKAA
jgi:hypothetical protein